MTYLEVAVAAPLKYTLTYALDSSNETAPAAGINLVGRRVLVPLSGRRVTGYILGVSEEHPGQGFLVKQIVRILDDYPLFHATIIPFFRWITEYYHYPIGLMIKTALPGGLSPTSKKKIILKITSEQFFNEYEPALVNESKWLNKLLDRGQLSVTDTKKIQESRTEKKLFSRLRDAEVLEFVSFTQKDLFQEKKELCYRCREDDSLPLHSCGEINKKVVTKHRLRLAEKYGHDFKYSEAKTHLLMREILLVADRSYVVLKDLRRKYPAAGAALESLEEKGLVFSELRRIYRSPLGNEFQQYIPIEKLTMEQENVLAEICPCIDEKSYAPFLLHGITGCGKTEIYLRAAEKCLAGGRDVIILVPEIALATQLEGQLLSRFPGLVVVYHSGISGVQRYDQYFLALSGKAKVVLGARSAIFTPLADPGLIIVDEEHESAYKQDDNLRYNGRDLAVVRARHHGSVLLLGSATPSITSYQNAKTGKYRLLQIRTRVGKSGLPSVQVVDLTKNKSKERKGIIGAKLEKQLKLTLQEQKQAILLLNRRGFSSAMLCKNCGTPVQCNHCNVSLSLHKKRNRLICHYCGFTTKPEATCLQCRTTDFSPAGFGIERIEEELQEILPAARIGRLDSDSSADRKYFLGTLKNMHQGEIDILVGTQMIAKGHHFPNVTLVGVVWADGGMSLPDFKAAERSFQLITQVIGRAGRGDFAGEVIIQTMRPDHYAIRFAQAQDYESFFDHELELRRHPAFPPFVRLVLLRLQAKAEKLVQKKSVEVAAFCNQYIRSKKLSAQVLGPAPAPIDKVKDLYRYQILLKSVSPSELNRLCTEIEARQKELLGHSCAMVLDRDPENMM